MDELKLKASYGMQGNDAIGRYRYTDVFNIQNSDGDIGTSFESKGTEDITWETNANFNIGTEFSLFNRITGSIEYYNRKTTDMLFSFSLNNLDYLMISLAFVYPILHYKEKQNRILASSYEEK